MRTLYLCGAGNSEGVRLAHRVNEREDRWDRLVVLDDDPAKHGNRLLLDIEVAGALTMLADADPNTDQVANLVARTTAGRAAVRDKIAAYGIPFTTIVHPGVDTLGAELGDDVLVYEAAIVSPETVLGDGSVVLMRALVGHESQVARGCVIAPGAILNARVILDEGVYVGAGATIIPEIKVGAGATIAANSLVVSDVPAGASVMGVPAEPLGGEAEADPVADLDLEATILAIWSAALDVATLSAHDNFFDVGGNSRLALNVAAEIRRATGCALQPTDIFRFPKIHDLAEHLRGALGEQDARPGNRRAELRRVATSELRSNRMRARDQSRVS